MYRQMLRDWVLRFNAEGVDGLCDRPKSGRPTWFDDGQLATLKALVLGGPDLERDGVSTWRKDLSRMAEVRFGVAEVAVPRALFAEILRRIAWLRPRPLPT